MGLRHRRVLVPEHAGVLRPRELEQHDPAGGDVAQALHQEVLHQLEPRERPAELLPLGGVTQGEFVGADHDSEGLPGHSAARGAQKFRDVAERGSVPFLPDGREELLTRARAAGVPAYRIAELTGEELTDVEAIVH